MFQNITNMNQFIDITKLDMMWNAKKKQTLSPLDKMAEDIKKDQKISSITGKLMRGKKLSAKEMQFLRKNMPELHRKAVQAAAEREAYEEALKSCRTKEDVQRLHSEKMTCALAANKGDDEAAMIVTAAISDAHETFTKSFEYNQMPDEEKQQRQNGRNTKATQSQTNQKRYDSMEEMTDSQQKLHFIMQNYSAQAQRRASEENTEASASTAELLAEKDTEAFAKSQGSVESAKAFMESQGINIESTTENFVSFSTITHPTAAKQTSPPAATMPPLNMATINRAFAAYQTAQKSVIPTAPPVVDNTSPSLKAQA